MAAEHPTSSVASMCECGHPRGAHRLRYNGPKDPSGRHTAKDPCIATVTRRSEHGDDSWPCPCRDFREVRDAA